MPTPFYHLSIAEELLAHPALPPDVRARLHAERPAFLLGNTAPDVQVVSGHKRESTHFFQVPPRDETSPAERLLAEYPALADTASLRPAQAAFLAGYLCHLAADFEWIRTLFLPVFGVQAGWGTFPHRLYIHNVLRTWLDEQVLSGLPDDIAGCLAAARPEHWLPFVEDRHLGEWRDYLQAQLHPGAASRTVEVFARRQGLSPEEFSDLLHSEERLEAEVFSHVPRQDLVEYRQRLIAASLQWVTRTLANAPTR
ncbi:MAG: zinc dependent phospholipase C family protein [Chloroflexi bacterium]|nr:zinc dependent phospholipase C family protein [Chloroflexota bacterium]